MTVNLGELARLEELHAQAEAEQAADDAGPDEAGTTARIEASVAILDAFPALAAEIRRLLTENEELSSERDRGYMFLMRWQEWATDIARAHGWVPHDVLPDDTKTRGQISAALAEHGSLRDQAERDHREANMMIEGLFNASVREEALRTQVRELTEALAPIAALRNELELTEEMVSRAKAAIAKATVPGAKNETA